MTSLDEARDHAEKRVMKVDSTDVRAARLLMMTSKRLGKPVPAWVVKVAEADRKK